MKKTINYEKDILFKTNIGSICSISLEHDFTVDNGFLRGDFIVSGDYKPNELSINKEPFNYHLPLEYELPNNVDLSSLSYEVENFEYNVCNDVLTVYIDFGIRYDEIETEPIIPEAEELNIDDMILSKIDEDTGSDRVEVVKEETKEDRLDPEDKNMILNNLTDDDNYVKYHIHIVRDGDTLDSISSKYNVTKDLIKEYNNISELNVLDKIIIPVSNE